jgi:hypothetical protein
MAPLGGAEVGGVGASRLTGAIAATAAPIKGRQCCGRWIPLRVGRFRDEYRCGDRRDWPEKPAGGLCATAWCERRDADCGETVGAVDDHPPDSREFFRLAGVYGEVLKCGESEDEYALVAIATVAQTLFGRQRAAAHDRLWQSRAPGRANLGSRRVDLQSLAAVRGAIGTHEVEPFGAHAATQRVRIQNNPSSRRFDHGSQIWVCGA